MRWLFYADTPLQLYLSARIALTELSAGDEAEVMVCEQFPHAYKQADCLVKEGIFDKAHFCKPFGSRKRSFKAQAKSFLGMTDFDPRTITHERFDRLAVSIFLDITMSLAVGLRKANPDLEVILYEDGTGAYDGEAFQSSVYLGDLPEGILPRNRRAKMTRSLSKLMPIKPNVFTPSLLLLREPEAFPFKTPFPVRRIESTPEAIKKITRCFDGKPSPILKPGIIFLDSPRTPLEHIQDHSAFDALIKYCHDQGFVCQLREHPRTQERSIYADLCEDCTGGLWESLCCQAAVTESVLVSAGSTAQLTPFLETGKKPPLLFVYQLLLEPSSPYIPVYAEIVKLAERLYRNDAVRLICNASSLEEAVDFIKRSARSSV